MVDTSRDRKSEAMARDPRDSAVDVIQGLKPSPIRSDHKLNQCLRRLSDQLWSTTYTTISLHINFKSILNIK